MRKVALAFTGLLLALGGGAHGTTESVQGPSQWCAGHAQLPSGNTLTASAGVEQGRSAIGVYVCYEIGGSGSRPTSSHVFRAWTDPRGAKAAVECVPHKDARVAERCYERLEAPLDEERKAADEQGRQHGVDPEPSEESQRPELCEALCVDADEVVAQVEDIPTAVAEEVEENVPGR